MTEIIDKQMNRKKGRVAEKLIDRKADIQHQTDQKMDRQTETDMGS